VSPDRAASLAHRRVMGGSGSLPNTMRHHYTEGHRSVLFVISEQVKLSGMCDMPLDKIAAKARVCRSTAKDAIKLASKLSHLSVELRPRKGAKNLPNVLRIISREWLSWLKIKPSKERQIGVKIFHPTKNRDKNNKSVCAKLPPSYTRGNVVRGYSRGASPQPEPRRGRT
jgi:hypothetical protein